MNSLGRECNELKSKYDECFNVWFSQKFLKGDTNDDMCKPLFLVYRDCIRVSTHFNSAMSSLAISSYKNDTDKQWQFILLPGKICDVSSFVTQNYKQMDSDCHSSIRIQYKIIGFFCIWRYSYKTVLKLSSNGKDNFDSKFIFRKQLSIRKSIWVK